MTAEPPRVPGPAWAYLALACVTVGGRVLYLLHDQTFMHVSGAELERAAASLAREGTLGNVYADHSGPSAHVSPLYPLVLSLVYRMWGWNTVAGRIAQETMAIGATTISLLLLPRVATAARLSVPAAWLAAAALAVSPAFLWVETSGSWEQPFSALAVLGIVLVAVRLQVEGWERWRTVLAAGGLVGLAALLSPVLLPAAALALAASWSALPPRRLPVRPMLAVVVLAAAVASPWVVRNYVTFGVFVPLRGNFGLELAIGNNDWANGRTFVTAFDDRQNPMMASHPFTSPAERDRLLAMGEAPYMAGRRAEAVAWIAAHPGRAAWLVWRRFVAYWFPAPDNWAPSSAGRVLKSFFLTATAVLLFARLGVLFVARHPFVWILTGSALGPSLLYMVTHVDPRYRYPVVALTTLVAADGVVGLAARLRRGRSG